MRQWTCQVVEEGGTVVAVATSKERHRITGLPAVGSWVVVRDDGTHEVLAHAGTRRAELIGLVVDAGIAPVHDEAVHALAEERAADLALHDLTDLSHLPFVPIDEPTSRDLDQAVAIARRGDGYVVWYALADAAWFVRVGDALYEDAIARGATYYLPGLVVPMLPRILSEDAISLNAGVDRRAMVFELTLDATGACTDCAIHRARVRCRHKLDFAGVQAFLDGAPVDWDPDVQASLRLLPEVGQRRIALAESRGVIQYRRTEVDVKLHERRFVALDGPRNDVERYNEQISLLTNVQGARFLRDHHAKPSTQPIYRVHEAPAASRYGELATLSRQMAALHGLDADRWVWRPADQPLATWLDGLPPGPVAAALHRQAMVINRPSHFASSPGVHHGVGADVYGRFTAPMREVVGIFLHQEVWEVLGHAAPDPDHGEALAERVIRVSNAARERQRRFDREVNRLVLDDLFANATGGFPGVILGLTPSRVHVQLDRPTVDVKVYAAHLEAHRGTTLTLIDATHMVDAHGTPVFRLGDRVEVHVVGRDAQRDRWELRLAGSADVAP
jgi:ribonuclease R